MEALKKSLAMLCTPDCKIRETYFSQTYRQTFKLNGRSGTWDILYICIPFSREKEAALLQRLGNPKEDTLQTFYQTLTARIGQERMLLRELAEASTAELCGGTWISYEAQSVFPHPKEPEWGREYYFITEPMETLSEHFCLESGAGMTKETLMILGGQLTDALMRLQGTGIHAGTWDLDTLYVKKQPDGQTQLVVGSLLYGSKEGKSLLPQLSLLPTWTHALIQQGKELSLSTDLYAVGAMLRALAEPHQETEPNAEAWETILERCLKGGGEEDLQTLHEAFWAMAREQGAKGVKEDDPMLEGMEIIENFFALEDSEQEKTPLSESMWEIVDLPFQAVQEEPRKPAQTVFGAQQRTPLKPRKPAQNRPYEPDERPECATKHKRRVVLSLLAGVLVIAIGLGSWNMIFLKGPASKDSLVSEETAAVEDRSEPDPQDAEPLELGPVIQAAVPEEESTPKPPEVSAVMTC